jgi:hypothetical protein
MFSTSDGTLVRENVTAGKRQAKMMGPNGVVTEISWTGAGEKLQDDLGLEVIQWCDSPSPEQDALVAGANAGDGKQVVGFSRASAAAMSVVDMALYVCNQCGTQAPGKFCHECGAKTPLGISRAGGGASRSGGGASASAGRSSAGRLPATAALLASIGAIGTANAVLVNALVKAGDETRMKMVKVVDNRVTETRATRKAKLRMQQDNYWLQLSEELVINIFGFLDQPDLGRACLVCQNWKRLAYDESLWRSMAIASKKLAPEMLQRALVRNPRHLQVLDCDLIDFIPLTKEYHHIKRQPLHTLGVRRLNLSTTRINDADIAALLQLMPELRSLEFGGNRVGPETVAAIANCPKLTCLSLRMVDGLTEEGFDLITKACTQLKVLCLGWTCNRKVEEGPHEFVASLVQSLATNCRGLEHLDVSGCREYITDGLVNQLVAGCTLLKTLDLSDSYVLTDESVNSMIEHLVQIESIALSRCHRINVPAMQNLARKPGLKAINLFGCYQEIDHQMKESAKHIAVNNMKLCALKFGCEGAEDPVVR